MAFSKVVVSHAGERDGKSIWRVEKPLRVFFKYKGKVYKIIIPEGFLTDFGSIPKLAQSIYSPTDPDMIECFIFHDYLYEKNGRIIAVNNGKADLLNLSRYESDLIPLWRMAGDEGAGFTKRAVIFNSVRAGGWSAWNSHKKLKRGERFELLSSSITR